ncbi:MAG: IS5 family transposase, partial [Bacteroidota bacterium]|nr:IS5 family transposase [Bacteroidota bacterium]
MKPKIQQSSVLPFSTVIENQIDLNHPIAILSKKIRWSIFEEEFTKLYSQGMGRPGKPIRLLTSLLILKHVRNLSDESVVEQWSENIYYQYFSGEQFFVTKQPCEASELVHFRHRIGSEGIELILKESITINGKDSDGLILSADTTVQEKNITYPTDDKLYKKIIKRCNKIADERGIDLRQSYTTTVKRLGHLQRFRKSKKHYKLANKADRKIKTIAGRLMREIERKLDPQGYAKWSTELEIYKRIIAQKRNDHNKIYSIHEPHVECLSKGKEHKKYEFGNKVSILITQKTGVIVGAISIDKNKHDSKTTDEALKQYERMTGKTAEQVYVDRGYRGISMSGNTEIKVAGKQRNITQSQKRKHSRRAAIEPKISHLKSDHRLGRNYYKGIVGD